jgi:hypothetical protein
MNARTAVVASAVLFGLAPCASGQPQPARTVTLPLAEYNRLIDLANRPPQPPTAAPVGAVLSSADVRVRVDRDMARGTFALAGDVLRAGVNRVNLVAGATLIEGSSAGRPLALATDGATHSALLTGPGPFALTLEWGTPVVYAPGRASFGLPVPQAGTARATLDFPGEQADVHLSAGLITRRSTANGRTIVDVTLRPGDVTTVSWSMRDSAPVAAAREARMLADVFTLVTLGDSDVRMVALVDVTVAQGEPRTIEVTLPAGYDVAGVSGSTLEASDPRDGAMVLTLSDPSARRHQFLVSLERPHGGGSFSLETDVVSLPNVQRERGEIAIEGVGTLDLDAAERPPLHRIDARELNGALQSLARLPVLSAFRYQRTAGTPIALALDVRRFADAGVLAAVADRAVATTLVTSEGRALTQILLTIQNRAQPFLKVELPAGATMVSVEVGGQAAKPATGTDGTRVPLLRSGFRPGGPYQVSFVYLHAGTPFARKGEMQMTLPKMDIPVGMLEWEVFVPESYSVRASDGNVIDRRLLHAFTVVQESGYQRLAGPVTGGIVGGLEAPPPAFARGDRANGVYLAVIPGGAAGLIRGRVADETSSALPGATVTVVAASTRLTATTDAGGVYTLSGVPEGPVTITAELSGFRSQIRSFASDRSAKQVDFMLGVSSVTESVAVTGGSSFADKSANAKEQAAAPPSQNVLDLQKRAAGVLPIRVDVPRAGVSHQFVKPLVVDQQAMVMMKYKRRN